ncbi:hypothetical protein GF377_04060 [candidate division GN15 bacterium]|nr:hypothetical protein [candidate division GN15 bacterium]
MAKKSNTVKEIIQIVVFLLVVGILLTAFVIYPLGTSKDMFARTDLDDFNPDSIGVNDATAFVEAGFLVDTFTVEPETLTKLAAVRLEPAADDSTALPPQAWRGTAILLPDEHQTRQSVIPMARALVDSGFAVITYDQRATGLSTGEYHSDGQYEATDLAEMISYLRFRELIRHPFVAVGHRAGGDAVLLEAIEDPRLDGVAAIQPYLSTDRWMEYHMDQHGMWWIPFPYTVTWFWYGMRSDYAAPYREVDAIQGVPLPALLVIEDETRETDEFERLAELTDDDLLTDITMPPDDQQLVNAVMDFVLSLEQPAADTMTTE